MKQTIWIALALMIAVGVGIALPFGTPADDPRDTPAIIQGASMPDILAEFAEIPEEYKTPILDGRHLERLDYTTTMRSPTSRRRLC